MLRVRFDTDNACFDDGMKEVVVASILRELADRIETGECTGLFENVKDLNGNIIGTFKLD